MAQGSPAGSREALALEAQGIRDRIRQGAFWPNTAEFDHAVRRVYELEEAAEAALAKLLNQMGQ